MKLFTPKYYCIYCNQSCKKAVTKEDIRTCDKCHVFFYNNEEGLRCIELSHSFKDKPGRYQINLYPQTNRTQIICWTPYPSQFTFGGLEPDIREVVLDVPTLVNITPTNVADKLKTILTFQ